MIDVSTRQPLRVSDGGTAGPYLIVPVGQLTEVCALLDENAVSYWVDDEAISIDGGPESTVVNFERGADRNEIQRLLDKAS